MSKKSLSRSSNVEIAAFLHKAASVPVVQNAGHLIFALDATASRQATWDQACQLQGEMFLETASLGGLSVQLSWYRGFNEFKASRWHTNSAQLLAYMNQVYCVGGMTQISRVLKHALTESKKHHIDALVFVGDCVEEQPASLFDLAGQLGLLGIPVFVFHEGGESRAAAVFRHVATLSKGAYCQFDAGSAHQLKALLRAAAVYATGGRKALQNHSRGQSDLVKRLSHQLTDDLR